MPSNIISLVIFGSGDHAKVIFSEIINDKKIKFLGFIDDYKRKGELIIRENNKNFYNLGKMKNVLKKKNKFKGIVGVGHNFLRKDIFKNIKKIDKSFQFIKVISKNAIINPTVTIGDGTTIMPGATINKGTIIKEHCIINTSASIDHDNLFEDFSSTGPGVVTGGNVIIKEQSYLGIGCVVKNNIKIHEKTIIGANSLVNKNCEANYIYYGSPIKKIRKRKDKKEYL